MPWGPKQGFAQDPTSWNCSLPEDLVPFESTWSSEFFVKRTLLGALSDQCRREAHIRSPSCNYFQASCDDPVEKVPAAAGMCAKGHLLNFLRLPSSSPLVV